MKPGLRPDKTTNGIFWLVIYNRNPHFSILLVVLNQSCTSGRNTSIHFRICTHVQAINQSLKSQKEITKKWKQPAYAVIHIRNAKRICISNCPAHAAMSRPPGKLHRRGDLDKETMGAASSSWSYLGRQRHYLDWDLADYTLLGVASMSATEVHLADVALALLSSSALALPQLFWFRIRSSNQADSKQNRSDLWR